MAHTFLLDSYLVLRSFSRLIAFLQRYSETGPHDNLHSLVVCANHAIFTLCNYIFMSSFHIPIMEHHEQSHYRIHKYTTHIIVKIATIYIVAYSAISG